MTRSFRSIFLAVSLTVGIAMALIDAATAATITRTYSFTVTDWTPVGTMAPAPIDPVTGTFTVTFDPTGPVVTNQPLTITGFSLPTASIGITVNDGQAGKFQIGGTLNGLGGLLQGASDFAMGISAAHLPMPQFDAFLYTDPSDQSGIWFANTRVLTFVEGTGSSPVPEPATLGLFGICLVALWTMSRRQRGSARS